MYRVLCWHPEDLFVQHVKYKEGNKTPFASQEVWKDYLATNSPVTPKPEGNAIILDAPPNVDTVHGVGCQFVSGSG